MLWSSSCSCWAAAVRCTGSSSASPRPTPVGRTILYISENVQPYTKADTRGADDLDDYDYGEDEEDEDYEFEDENTADSEEDKNQ